MPDSYRSYLLERPRLRGRFHQVAFFLTIPAGVLLFLAGRHDNHRAAAVVFTVTLAGMYGASSALHRGRWSEPAWRIVRRLDHAAIYLLIAGTYTAFGLVALRGPIASIVLGLIWLGAGAGVLLKLLWFDRLRALSAGLYIVMGWAAMIAIPEIVRSVSLVPLLLLFSGGMLYTTGAVVLLRRRPDPLPGVFGYHEVWHAMVVGGTLCHYVMLLLLVLERR